MTTASSSTKPQIVPSPTRSSSRENHERHPRPRRRRYDDAYLLVRWLHELTSAEPNAAVVASLEDVCEDRGWHPYDAWQAITAGCGLTAAFDPDRHPRGHDGRFIELGALLKIVGGDREGQRGEVEAITPDPADPGNPTIRLKLRDGGTVDVKRDSVEQAAEKARLDIAPAPAAPEKKGGIFGRRKNREAEAQQQFRKDAGVEVNPETGLTERQEDTVNGEARDEWQKILLEEWIAEHPGEDPKTAPNLYAPAMEEVLKRRREGRPPGPANGEANKYDAELKERNRGTAASGALTAATKWAGDLHPRGRDGKFIEKLGMVELFDVKGLEPGTRGKVTSIAPSKQSPGRPDILIQLLDPKTGKLGRKAINVKPDNIAGAPEKGRLDPEGNVVPEAPAAPKNVGPEGAFDEPRRGRPPSEQPAPLTVEQQEQRLAAEEVRGATDEELERQRSLGPEVWQRAVAKEQANRQARRAQENAGRQKLIDSINADAANLSTTDPEERARGLDDILAKLRFSIIDTDKVHDHIYPPGESGRWSAERAAQHEQMWDDLLSQVEAASIPQERDALVLGGLPGAGKSYMLKPGQKADKFGVVSWEPNGDLPEGVTHVSINPDIVKEMLIATRHVAGGDLAGPETDGAGDVPPRGIVVRGEDVLAAARRSRLQRRARQHDGLRGRHVEADDAAGPAGLQVPGHLR